MTLHARAPAVFVGTAKSVPWRPTGWFEDGVMRRAPARFVRDEPTARAVAPTRRAVEAANVIVDLFAVPAIRRRERCRAKVSPGARAVSGKPRERVRRCRVFARE